MTHYNSRFAWHSAVNNTIDKTLENCYPRNWKDENHLTRCVLMSLQTDHSHVTIEKEKVYGKSSTCSWDIYKNTKEKGMEQKHGDIGILVQLCFDKTKILEGVAFLEAKRIYHDPVDDTKSKFSALDKSQLERYCKNSHYHRTVFYDCIKTPTGTKALSMTLPTQHLLTIDQNNRELYQHCDKFSYCLTNRYFQGYELDFNPKSVQAVKGFLDSNGGVKYLIVAQTNLRPDLSLDLKSVEINNNMYRPLKYEEQDITFDH